MVSRANARRRCTPAYLTTQGATRRHAAIRWVAAGRCAGRGGRVPALVTTMIPVVVPWDSSRSKEFQPGDVVDGRYRVLRTLADGGMGTVFLAEHLLIKRRVAIKLLHAELASDSGMVH